MAPPPSSRASPLHPVLVSVVTIFLNGERFLAEAVESVLAQTYPTWELVLVDDGSTDRSPDIARAFAEAHPERIRSVQHPDGANHGMSASRNLGVAHTRGALVAFLDADDVYRPEKLALQVAALAAHPEAGMVYGATEHWYSWAAEDARPDIKRSLGVAPDTLVLPPVLARLYLTGAAQTPGTCGVVVRRKTFEAVGGFEPSFRGLYEDQVFFYKMALHAPIYVQSGTWDRYRQHPDSAVQRLYARGLYGGGRPTPERHRLLTWLGDHLAEHDIGDTELRRQLYWKAWPYRHPALYAALAPARMPRAIWKLFRTTWANRPRRTPSMSPSP